MLNFLKNMNKKHRQWPKLSLEEIKKRARILVIDDDEFAYVALFQKEHYSIDKWDDVQDLSKLEEGYYDLILLDIQGVGQTLSEEQGFGVLKHLRAVSPSLIIIAYSNADYSLKYQEFFDLADSKLAKTADFVDFKRTVDDYLKKRFSFGFYFDRICEIAQLKSEERLQLRENIEECILNDKTDQLKVILQAHHVNRENVQLALSVAQVAVGIAAI